ncbi:hypothetical protein D3C72_2214640 [compost metagenome]
MVKMFMSVRDFAMAAGFRWAISLSSSAAERWRSATWVVTPVGKACPCGGFMAFRFSRTSFMLSAASFQSPCTRLICTSARLVYASSK